MKVLDFSRYAFSICVTTILLAGCGGSQPPIGAPTSQAQSTRRPSASVHFAYVANFESNSVSAYIIDASSGALTQVQGSPFSAGFNPIGVAIDPTRKFLYATNLDSNNVSAYAINASSGALTQVKGSPFKSGLAPEGVAIR